MDITSDHRWLRDMGMENPATLEPQLQLSPLNHWVDMVDSTKTFDFHPILSQKQAKKAMSSKTSSKIISFGNMNMKPEPDLEVEESVDEGKRVFTGAPSRIPSRAQEHVLAERKRRERLTQRFIALSSLIPGLKKLDKASVLGDAIKYIKHLQDRKKTLEKAVKSSNETVVCIKKSVISGDEDKSQTLPEIEVRVSNSDLLIRIHCERLIGVTAKITSEIEKLHLTMINTVCMPFGHSTVDITILAQKDKDFNLAAKEVVQKLRSALLNNIM